ncbi:MAG: nitroreductase family protein [Anaerolineae bacterium]|nr:nitroreductase family protein [Anaerolineae bacterium]
MALNFGRTGGTATVRIDEQVCTNCGLCVKVCKGAPLYIENGHVCVDQTRYLGCIGCGHCMAVCPHGCITVTGRDLSRNDLLDMPPRETRATYEQLTRLMSARRSMRNFQDREVEREIIDKIVAAASTAPMGIPPSEVHVLVLAGRDKVQAFRNDLLDAMRSAKWMFSPFVLGLLRPFIGQEAYELYHNFVVPAVDAYVEKDEAGIDWFFYDAPLSFYFCASPYADPADPFIAATYAMLAGEALGLGSCMLGFPGQILQYHKKLRARYGLLAKAQAGIAVILGYPAIRFQHAIERRFARVQYR